MIRTWANYFKSENKSETILFVLLSVFTMSLPFSKSFISIFSVLALVFSIYIGLKNKTLVPKFSSDYSWVALVAIYMVYLFGLIFTRDIKLGLYEINKEVNWFVLPLALFLMPRLSKQKVDLLFFLFLVSVSISSLISFAKMIYASDAGLMNFREVNFISHINFSLQISFALFILLYSFFGENSFLTKIRLWQRIVLVIWFLFILVAIKSMLGLISFYVASIFYVLYFIRRMTKGKVRSAFLIMAIVFYIIPLVYVASVTRTFYAHHEPSYENAEKYTKQGNPYVFDLGKKDKENGYYVYWYLCFEEMENAWNERSTIKFYDRLPQGYRVAETLQRYLTSKGLKKDAEGVAALSSRDIRNVEAGIANYIYDAPVYAIYPRVYETIWEIDKYIRTGDPNSQSLSQRFEYFKAAQLIIDKHFWIGVGTGNFKDAYYHAFKEMGSKLHESNYSFVHNQYVSYWVKFGLLGLLFIIFLLIFVAVKKNLFRNGLFVLFFVLQLVANMGDANWETHVGLAFFVFFFSLFLWHTNKTETKDMQKSPRG